jgi:hypothetical protein
VKRFPVLIALACAALAFPVIAVAKRVNGFHAAPGIRCEFGHDSVTCVTSRVYEFEKPCKTGDQGRLWLHARAGASGCTTGRLQLINTGYPLRSGALVQSQDGQVTCSLLSGQLTCRHLYRGGQFEFYVQTGNVQIRQK